MATPLFPTGVRMNDSADVLAQANFKQTAFAAGVTTGTIPAGAITGGVFVALVSAATTPGTQTTRTAAQLYADDATAWPGQVYKLRICQSGAGTMTLAGGTGVTVVGTATVATTTFRDFVVAYSGTSAIPLVTITNVGLGTYT